MEKNSILLYKKLLGHINHHQLPKVINPMIMKFFKKVSYWLFWTHNIFQPNPRNEFAWEYQWLLNKPRYYGKWGILKSYNGHNYLLVSSKWAVHKIRMVNQSSVLVAAEHLWCVNPEYFDHSPLKLTNTAYWH